MKISNMRVVALLANDVSNEAGATTTVPLEVVVEGEDYVVVRSANNPDMLIWLAGINVSVGSHITVNVQTGDVTVVSQGNGTVGAKPTSTKTKAAAPAHGCMDRSLISR